EKWIVKDGWLANSGPMTLRLDKDTADAVVKDNMTATSIRGVQAASIKDDVNAASKIFIVFPHTLFLADSHFQAWLEQNARL
ncbi:hypothetical protein ACUOFC_63520, partial [Escherichia sp. TWPC-MK]